MTSSGQRFAPPPANLWDNMQAAGQAYGDDRLGKPRPGDSLPRPTDVIKIKNSSGGNLVRGDVLEIDDFLLGELAAEFIWFDGVTPTAQENAYAILLTDLPNGEIGRAQVSGVCLAMLTSNDATKHFASSVASSSKLDVSDGGFARILARKQVASQWWAVVNLGGYSAIYKKRAITFSLDEELTTSMNEADATIEEEWGLDSEVANTASTVTVKNPVTDTANEYIFSAALGTHGVADWVGGDTYLIKNMHCKPPE